jgi:hypothetical protein
MLDKPFSVLLGIGTLVYVGAILIESTPQSRLNVACGPVRWGGNILGSIAALSDSEKFTEKVASGTDELGYGCEFTLWRLVYGNDYSNYLAKREQGGVPSDHELANKEVLLPGGVPKRIPVDRGEDRQESEKVRLIDKTK